MSKVRLESGADITVTQESMLLTTDVEWPGKTKLPEALSWSKIANLVHVPLPLPAEQDAKTNYLQLVCARIDELTEAIDALLTPGVYESITRTRAPKRESPTLAGDVRCYCQS